MKILPFPLLLAALLAPAFAEEKRGDNPDAKPSPSAEQQTRFKVPPGFEVQLVADETQIQKPMNLNFDAQGRLWVTGSELYPWAAKTDALGQPIPHFDKEWSTMSGSIGAQKPEPPAAPIDSVRILSDFGPDGRARKVEVFADKLNVPIGVMPLPRKAGAKGDTCIVYSIPTIWRMEDTDGDGKADVREPLYTGFGFRDTHGMSSNYLYWIDGWIYGCHGFANHSEVRDRAGKVTVLNSGNTYRFRPDGSRFEVYTNGQTNPFGLTVDPLGNFYSCDSHSKPAYLLIRGGFYEGIGKQHDGLGFAPAIMQHSHGSSSIAGIAYYAAEQFPEEFRGNLFIGNPVTRTVNRDRLEWTGSTPKAIEMPDFLTCDDPWFRPVQVKLGPDGALYIADFYNPIIGHYEQPLLDPRRDHKHGRIWRVVWKGNGAAQTPLPNLAKLEAAGLVEKFADANLIVRTLATHELVERVGESQSPAWLPLISKSLENQSATDEAKRLATSLPHLLWAKERLHAGPFPDVSVAALHRYPTAVLAALPRVISPTFLRNNAAEGRMAELFVEAIRTSPAGFSGTAKIACVEFMADHPSSDTVARLLDLTTLTAAEDHELRYAIRGALRDNLAALSGQTAFQKVTQLGIANPQASELLADAGLAVKTPAVAEFLIAHLQRTNFAAPRSGEYLSHAAKHLPAERLGELAALAEKLKDAPEGQRLAFASGLAQAARERGLQLPETLRPWLQTAMISALESKDAGTVDAAIAAVKDSADPAKLAALERIAGKAGEHGPRRAAALEALMKLPQGREVLARAMADPSSNTLRRKAVELIVKGGFADLASKALPTVPGELAAPLALALARSDADCGTLLTLLEAGKAPATVLRSKPVADALAQRPAALRERAAALTRDLPPEDARLDGVIVQRVEAMRQGQPNLTRGQAVFTQHCAVCHKFRDAGGNLAPNLDGVAARGVHRLAEDILDPNRNVDGTFRQVIVETKEGQTLAGVNLRESPDALTLTDATGKDFSVARGAIKAQSVSRLSLMPPIFETQIPAADFNDLLAYLLNPGK